MVLCGDWERPLAFPDGRVVPITNRSLEFYDREKPYTVAALFDRTWELQEYYARLIRPPQWEFRPRILVLELLGLDVQITPDYDYALLEHETVDDPEAVRRLAQEESRLREGVLALLEEVERREGPFDPEKLRGWVEQVRRT